MARCYDPKRWCGSSNGPSTNISRQSDQRLTLTVTRPANVALLNRRSHQRTCPSRPPGRIQPAAKADLAQAGLRAFVPRVPHDDAVLAALRSRMDDAAFEEAQAWGGSAGSKRAVEYALEQA
jgi:hypothetical protein